MYFHYVLRTSHCLSKLRQTIIEAVGGKIGQVGTGQTKDYLITMITFVFPQLRLFLRPKEVFIHMLSYK